jgi:ankyrin repeat protein
MKKHLKVARELLNRGADVNTADKYGCTPLFMAVLNGDLEMLRELLNHGADMNIAEKEGFTPLYAAHLTGHVKLEQELRNHGAVLFTSHLGMLFPSALAAAFYSFEFIDNLVQKVCNLINIKKRHCPSLITTP